MDHKKTAAEGRASPHEAQHDTARLDAESSSDANGYGPFERCEQLIRRVRQHSPRSLDDLADDSKVSSPLDPASLVWEDRIPRRIGRFEIESLIGNRFSRRAPWLGRR